MASSPVSHTSNHTVLSILAIDDDQLILDLLRDSFEQSGVQLFTTTEPDEGLRLFRELRPDVVFLDLMMPKLNGMELLATLNKIDPATEILLMSGHYTPEHAVEAIRKGAADYVGKPLPIGRLKERIATLLQEKRRRHMVGQLDRSLMEAFQLEGIVGRSAAVLQVLKTLRRVAPHFRTALITGPSGTGKELVAHALHRLSPSQGKVMAVANCSALTETLVESELFGYVRGAFTGAHHDKIGIFEYANKGTVFLDEIGDMPLPGQAKLLRVLQNGEVQRVGSPVPKKVEVRVIAATNRDLRSMISQGTFREDLYYRLSMTEIALPSLTERKEDLPLLEHYFLQKFSKQYEKPVAGLTLRAQAILARYPWPGNIRELENVLGNACMMAESGLIDVNDLPPNIVHSGTSDDPSGLVENQWMTLEDVQKKHVLRVLHGVDGDKSRAATILGIARSTLYNLLEKYQADKS